MSPTQLANAVVRRWVCLYTAGMPQRISDERRLEIASDLWEQEIDAEARGVTGWSAAQEILVRTSLGAADDVGWRLEAVGSARAASTERSATMVTQSARHVRWMGLAGFIAGVVWSGRYFVPFEPSDAVREYGHVLLSVLFVVGLIGFYAQQADRLTRTAKAGSLFLLLSLGSWLGLNVLDTLLRIGDQTALLMNILGVAFAFALPPGFLLLGLGMKGAARLVPLAIGCVFLASFVVPTDLLLRYLPWASETAGRGGPLGTAAFFLMGIGLAAMGYSVFRSSASAELRTLPPAPASL